MKNAGKSKNLTGPSADTAERVQAGASGTVPSTKKRRAKVEPTARQAKYAANRAMGMNKTQAALAAGYTPASADKASRIDNTRAIQENFRNAIRAVITPQDLAAKLKEGLEATKTEHFAFEGIVVDERTTIAFGERRQYIESAAKLGGYHVPTSAVQGAMDGPPIRTDIGDALGQLFVELDESIAGK